ncbi:unnamed protein product [Didymodactylos carnosus]|uniref:TIR domain-containing protein n=1 Tax=Didymodactylos carnosus TaxID=1234261 RepID=A0A814AQ70_9BILA|nr:unnamed protein product [Didymodactylos carnosus]CAF3696122.1 unnamed protein product [Didymodactylos carnosus]
MLTIAFLVINLRDIIMTGNAPITEQDEDEASHEAQQGRDLLNDFLSILETLRQFVLLHSKHPVEESGENNDDSYNTELSDIANRLSDEAQNLLELASENSKETLEILQKVIVQYANILSINNCDSVLDHEDLIAFVGALNNVTYTIDFNNLLENDYDFARKIFYSSFDICSLPGFMEFLQNQCSIQLATTWARLLTVLLLTSQQAAGYVTFVKNDLKQQEPLLKVIAKYIDDFFVAGAGTLASLISTMDNPLPSQGLNTDALLNLLWTLCDKTILVPNFINTNYHELTLKWINMECLQYEYQRPVISILHNLARHDRGADALTKCNAIQVLGEFKKRVLDPDQELYPEMNLLYCMTISLLSDPKENKGDAKSMHKILDKLLQTAMDASQTKNFKSGGFHISEPIIVLTKLSVHDEILKYILNEARVNKPSSITSVVQFFCEVLMRFRGALANDDEYEQITLTAVFNIVWSISFHDEYVDELKSNSKFMLTLKSLINDDGEALVDQYVPQHMSSVKKAGNGILWNLDENNPARTGQSTTTPAGNLPACEPQVTSGKNNRSLVMVSYSHADTKFCQQLVNALKKDNRFDIWVDFAYCHTEDLWEEIGQAIEKADVVLFLMTKDYYDSKSCRQEVMYAKDSLKKRFIPIYVQKEFVATGWLGIRVVGPQYIRFGKKPFDDTVPELIELILDDVKNEKVAPPVHNEKPQKSVTDDTTHPVVDDKLTTPLQKASQKEPEKQDEDNVKMNNNIKLQSKSIDKWSSEEISLWFRENHIRSELKDLYEFYSGHDLLFYAEGLKPDWQQEYADIRDRYSKKYDKPLYRDQFVLLVSAMHRLQTQYEPKPNQNLKTKSSSTCAII